MKGFVQGCGSLIWVAGSGSGRTKITQRNRKKYRIFMFWSAGCSLLRAEGFSCSLCVFYGGQRISKLQSIPKKIYKKLYSCKFFSIFGHRNLVFVIGSGSAIRKNAGSGSALNQWGSTTLLLCIVYGTFWQTYILYHRIDLRAAWTRWWRWLPVWASLTRIRLCAPRYIHYKNNVYDRSVPHGTFFPVLRIRDILVRTPWIRTSD